MPFALLSTSDKTGLVPFANRLVNEHNFQLISSGGTATTLIEAGLSVIKVGDYTGFPEMLDGRVKTLHPKIHGGILARRDIEQDNQDLAQHNINLIDLVVVNLYPFQATIAQPDVTIEKAIAQIDVGGPTMIRAAAKNHQYVTVLCQPDQYQQYLEEMVQNNHQTTLEFRQKCAYQAFSHTANYDIAISQFLATRFNIDQPNFYITGQPIQPLRYGENPHQSASWYKIGNNGFSIAQKIQGKELSYNNLVDLEAARDIIKEFPHHPAAAILKHTNPCGVAIGETLLEAYDKAFKADATSAFGGIVALNRPIDIDTANALKQTFLECILAPGCTDQAAEILASKKNLRVLILPEMAVDNQLQIKAIAGGILVQSADNLIEDIKDWKVVTERSPNDLELAELSFAWKVVKHLKSNAIAVTNNRVTLGLGVGQMNRVGSVEIALKQAQEAAKGAYLASDGFFPFDDSVRLAAKYGITGIIQPGGSQKDQDSINAANELGLIMIMTGVRHFLH